MAARLLAEDDRKTWVFPIIGFSTDLCVQFSEKNEIYDEELWNGYFFLCGREWMGCFFFFCCGSKRLNGS